jgi:hypothetical protein
MYEGNSGDRQATQTLATNLRNHPLLPLFAFQKRLLPEESTFHQDEVDKSTPNEHPQFPGVSVDMPLRRKGTTASG